MIKKILIAAMALVAGTAIAFWSETELRNIIQHLFRVLTGHRIQFYGKNFHLFSPASYYLAFGIFIMVAALTKVNLPRPQVLKFLLIEILTFAVSLVTVCLIFANKLVMECTACEEGIRKIHYNSINYLLMVLLSLSIAVLPSAINQIRRMTRRTHK